MKFTFCGGRKDAEVKNTENPIICAQHIKIKTFSTSIWIYIMKSKKITCIIFKKSKRLCFLLSITIFLPLLGHAGSAYSNYSDSVKYICNDEIAFIIDHIENTYISGRRGINDEEWNKNKSIIYSQLQNFFDKGMEGYYVYVWRYLNLLKDDAHFKFPDDGMFNRWGYFKKDDYLFPLWVQTWKDGSVYNVKDYKGVIPRFAQILSVNGRSAKEMALMNRAIGPGEEANAMAMMNAKYEANPASWPNFANFLFMEGIRAPFEVVYIRPDNNRQDTVILGNISREEMYRQFKKSGDKRKVKSEVGFGKKPIVYENLGDGIGVLSIKSFWGKRWAAMLLFGKDWRYKRLLRRAMRRIDRDNIKDLIIDVSLNGGGMTDNIYYTLDYFTDRPIEMNSVYHVTDNNRELIQTNIERSETIKESDRERLVEYVGILESGTVFCTDTVCDLQYLPSRPKHGFGGNVYVLTGHQTYSAAQMFARYCQTLGIGPTAGQHCGGYNEITGNAASETLPRLSYLEFKVPFGSVRINKNDDPYDYPPVDIPIDHPFEEWLKRENRSLDRLIGMIRNGTAAASASGPASPK